MNYFMRLYYIISVIVSSILNGLFVDMLRLVLLNNTIINM